MPRLFSYKKGQWFIMSAVFISSAFLIISMLFKSYFPVGSSSIAERSEVFFFKNIQEQLNRTVDLSTCDVLEQNLKEFAYFSEKKMAEKGYMLAVNSTINSCPLKSVTFTMVLASDVMHINRTWTHTS